MTMASQQSKRADERKNHKTTLVLQTKAERKAMVKKAMVRRVTAEKATGRKVRVRIETAKAANLVKILAMARKVRERRAMVRKATVRMARALAKTKTTAIHFFKNGRRPGVTAIM